MAAASDGWMTGSLSAQVTPGPLEKQFSLKRKDVEEEEEKSRNLALMWIPHQDDFQHNFTDLTSLHPELSDIC